jgi:hypothetical protein
MRSLTEMSDNASTLTFSAGAPIQNVTTGDVIVSGVSEVTPDGMLRKVDSVTRSGSEIVVRTSKATIEDAIQKGHVSITKSLSAADLRSATPMARGVSLSTVRTLGPRAAVGDFSIQLSNVVIYDADGDETNTTNDQVVANGSIRFSPSFTFELEVDDFHLRQLTFTNTTMESTSLTISTSATLPLVDATKRLYKHTFSPITVWVGYVPVVITPVFEINVGVHGEVSVGLSAGVSQESTLTAGLTYNNGAWSPISEFTNTFQFQGPTLNAGATVKGIIGPRLELMLYGVAGPYGELNGYLELDADVMSNPWWILYGGIEANIGVEVDVLSHVVASYSKKVIDYRRAIAQSDSGFVPNGSVAGAVRDAVSGLPLALVSVEALSSTGSVVGSASTDASGQFQIPIPVGTGYKLRFTRADYLTATYEGIAVQEGTTTHLEAVLQIDTAHSGTGSVGGSILNALNGYGVSGLSVKVRSGINVMAGAIVASTSTQTDGSFLFSNLAAGNYTAEAGGTGYATTWFTIICIGGTSSPNQNATISPLLPIGETRVVLTWGTSPYDLDSHLTGPAADGSRFHIFYANRSYSYGGATHADLDLDDTTSYGPETVTIYRQTAGVYRYSVHDYSNLYSTNSSALSSSGAQVRVYQGAELVATFNVPGNQGGTLWTVFEIDGTSIRRVDTMSYVASPASVQATVRNDSVSMDAPLMRALPPKR